jgi:hypothetical protein
MTSPARITVVSCVKAGIAASAAAIRAGKRIEAL